MELLKLKLRLFGGLEWTFGEETQTLRDIDRHELLAFVAGSGGRVSRKIAAETLWSHVINPDEVFRKVLQDLRRALEQFMEGTPWRERAFAYLPVETGFVVLAPNRCSSDVGEFLAALRGTEETSPEMQFARLESAIRAYERGRMSGRLLEGYSWDWIEPMRESLETRYRAAVAQRDRLREEGAAPLPQSHPGSEMIQFG